MDIASNRAVKFVSIALIATVVLQLVYMAFLGGPQPAEAGAALTSADVIRYFDERGTEITAVWAIEAAAFIIIALSAFVTLARGAAMPVAWCALGLFGVFNLVQIGIGLAMFEPAARAGGDETGLFFVFVSGAFFFFYLAKLFLGIAATFFGLRIVSGNSAGLKVLGGLTLIAGLAAIGANFAAMAAGNSVLFIAGATGTAAALFTAVAAGFAMRLSR
ncbi:hypothetical protein GRI43_00425 [Altererythrobacter luteolus]|uniref:Uncharacterized protein n=1 Tax=Pontixanthobacter luteolus TaxID=295089 RepID=A0A6I4UYI2_9SPHN|nr:hypothetical protein [Pontixanthobacter luteolus]MXP45856.1 hypothetical protein [Pontixanthobacter luteolus]